MEVINVRGQMQDQLEQRFSLSLLNNLMISHLTLFKVLKTSIAPLTLLSVEVLSVLSSIGLTSSPMTQSRKISTENFHILPLTPDL